MLPLFVVMPNADVVQTLEYIQVINHINVMYVVKDLVIILTYTNTLEYTLVIRLINVIYVVKDLVRHYDIYKVYHLYVF
jgi:hypothetical protein